MFSYFKEKIIELLLKHIIKLIYFIYFLNLTLVVTKINTKYSVCKAYKVN